MLSSIKIDIADLGNEKGLVPVIFIKMVDSDDVRDKLLKTFFQQMGGSSSWLAVKFNHHIVTPDAQTTYINVTPVTSGELKQMADTIAERLCGENIEGLPKNLNPVVTDKQSGFNLTP